MTEKSKKKYRYRDRLVGIPRVVLVLVRTGRNEIVGGEGAKLAIAIVGE